MFKSFWDWALAVVIFIILVLMLGELFSFRRDRRQSGLFAALSYLFFAAGFSFYFGSSLWLRYVIGPMVFLLSIILYWVSYNARKEEHAPRAIFISKTQKEKETEKQDKFEKKRVADVSASATIASEKRSTTRIPTGGGKSVPGTGAPKSSTPRSGRK